MEFTFGVIIWQLRLCFHVYANDFEAPCYSGVFLGESLFSIFDGKFRTRFRLIKHQVLISRQFTVAVNMRIGIRPSIRQIGEEIPLVVVGAKTALFPASSRTPDQTFDMCGVMPIIQISVQSLKLCKLNSCSVMNNY